MPCSHFRPSSIISHLLVIVLGDLFFLGSDAGRFSLEVSQIEELGPSH